jgi:hypothetical protein
MNLTPQDTRASDRYQQAELAGKARGHAQGSSPGPLGRFCSDCGSLLAPSGERAEFARRPARSSDTHDLSGSLRSHGRWRGRGRVLNLCAGGMLVESSSDLAAAETVGFELAGPAFRYAGHAMVAHRADGTIGLRFVTWDAPVERRVRALVAARLRGQQLESRDAGELIMRRAAAWDARADRRAAVGGLSALIEPSPSSGAAARRHRVLDVGEHGMRIDDLALPVGAQISFVVSGRGLHHAGCARVAHLNDASAGVAVAHWHGAPQPIRALVRSETALRPRPETTYITDWS